MSSDYTRIGLVTGALILASLLIWWTDADLRLARLVYDEQVRWPGLHSMPWLMIYKYAAVPAFVLAGLALATLLLGFFARSLGSYRRQALFLILLLVLGPGLLVNVLFKDNLGRARPRELVEFGGQYQFSQIWERGKTGNNSSFPSGHGSVGFYMIGPWFLLRRRRPAWSALWLVSGTVYGSVVGAARILQGGHFLSDVLWAGGMVYLAGEFLALFLLPPVSAPDKERAATREDNVEAM